jgi:hypothetical protein
MNAVDVTIGTAFTSGKPRVLFREQAVAALEQAKESLLARARPALTSASRDASNTTWPAMT